MKIYKIPVSWIVAATLDIEAESLEEALDKADDDELPLPEDWEYIDGSWEVDSEMAQFILEMETQEEEENDNDNNNNLI